MKAIELGNVKVGEATSKEIQGRLHAGEQAVISVHPQLEDVIRDLAILKPTWTFTGFDERRMSVVDGVVPFWISAFSVHEEGEVLGTITREYTRRDYHIVISNQRIRAGRERGKGYTTLDPKKAIAKVKQTFSRKKVTERLDEALAQASDYIYAAVSKHSNKRSDAERKVERTARDWVLGEGFDTFMAWANLNMPVPKLNDLTEAHQKAIGYKAEMTVLEDMRSRIGTNKSALVVRDLDQYIVRIADSVQLYDDVTLPVSMRGRLGMLKLVEKEHFVEGAGCRVSDTVFLVIVDADEAANTVTQGESK